MSFSLDVKNELKNKCFTAKKRNNTIKGSGFEEYRRRISTAFLERGSIVDPKKAYMFEIVFDNADEAGEMAEILSRLDLFARVTYRKDSYVTYLQDADSISDVLNIMGAHKCLLDFENMRIYKSMREDIQRKVNCETANLKKTVNASVRQIEDIEYLEEQLGFENLPDGLREIAEIRLALPGATLQELADSIVPPIGKSGVNHRLRKLSKIAEDLRNAK